MSEKQEVPTHIFGNESAAGANDAGEGSAVSRLRPGRGLLVIFGKLLRPSLTTALTLPMLWGLALAHWHGAGLNGWSLPFLLLANGAYCIGLALAGQYADFRRSLRSDRAVIEEELPGHLPAKASQTPLHDVFHLLSTGAVRSGTVRSLVLLCLSVCLLCYLWLSAVVGWPLLFFGVLSILLAGVWLLPWIRYSRWQWVLGDLAVLIAMGLLPLLSAYYAQRDSIDRWVLLAAIAPAILAWLTFNSYTLLSWRRDWRLRRGTAVAVFGPVRAQDGAAVLGVAAFTSVLLLMAVGALPFTSLLVLGALPVFLRAFTRYSQQPVTHAHAVYIIERSTLATILAGLLWLLALWNG